MIIGLFGLKGSGKTLFMVILLWLEYTYLNSKVMANLKLSFKHKIINAKQLVELDKSLKNSAIGIDELHTICDSRRSGGLKNILMSYFVLQSRHRSVNFYYTSQFDGQVDKRIRENTDVNMVCENLYIDSDDDGFNDLFRVIIQDKRFRPIRFKQKILYGKPVFKLYNSDYIVDIFTMKELDKLKGK